jgi:hypothetical protein
MLFISLSRFEPLSLRSENLRGMVDPDGAPEEVKAISSGDAE